MDIIEAVTAYLKREGIEGFLKLVEEAKQRPDPILGWLCEKVNAQDWPYDSRDAAPCSECGKQEVFYYVSEGDYPDHHYHCFACGHDWLILKTKKARVG